MKCRETVVVVLMTLWGCARGSSGGFDDNAVPTFETEAGVSCVNLECRQDRCDGVQKTTFAAAVYDPAGKNPIYNAIVYVPNAPLAPFKEGASCDRCGSVLSGSPLVTALTDTNGNFVLENVPSGDDVPIVVQIGKWRREIKVPHIKACAKNELHDTDLFRLPRNQSEGKMPKIALSTGCDPLECLLRKIGIDDSEFTSINGKGAVHLYRGTGGGGVADSTSAYDFWSDVEKLKQYDVVINACECKPYPRGASAYPAMQKYLDMGGRFFGSHYHYNWFTDQPSEADLAVDWTPGGVCNNQADPPEAQHLNLIDTSFPKGRAMAEWLKVTGGSEVYGRIPLSCAPLDVARTKNKLAQGWIVDGPTGAPSYVSFNTPIDPAAAGTPAQCGRAVFADLHVSATHGVFAGQTFPDGCTSPTMTPSEKALEFMFFDLASCVLDDSVAPSAPPVK
jgi:hypothetical protein